MPHTPSTREQVLYARKPDPRSTTYQQAIKSGEHRVLPAAGCWTGSCVVGLPLLPAKGWFRVAIEAGHAPGCWCHACIYLLSSRCPDIPPPPPPQRRRTCATAAHCCCVPRSFSTTSSRRAVLRCACHALPCHACCARLPWRGAHFERPPFLPVRRLQALGTLCRPPHCIGLRCPLALCCAACASVPHRALSTWAVPPRIRTHGRYALLPAETVGRRGWRWRWRRPRPTRPWRGAAGQARPAQVRLLL